MHKLKIRNLSSSSEILLYGPVGEGYLGDKSITAESFKEQISVIPDGHPIDLRINSPGGAVFDGFAIYQALLPLRSRLTAHVDGQSSSIASVIMLAANRIHAAPTSWIMIHEPSMLAGGDSDDFKRYAELLDSIAGQIVTIYAKKTGKPEDEIRAAMKAETWLTGTAAKEFGLVDEVSSEVLEVAAMAPLEMFRNVPDALKNKNGKTPNIMPNETAQGGSIPVTQAPDLTAINATLAALNQSLNAEKAARRHDRLRAISAKNPTIQFDLWKDRVTADDTILDTLDNFPVALSDDGNPVRTPIQNLGKPIVENYMKLTAGPAREAFRIENWSQLEKNAADVLRSRNVPLNANTIAAALTPDIVADTVYTVAPNKLAAFSRFVANFTTLPMAPRTTVQVPFVSVGPTVLENPASFEAGDTTEDAKAIAVNHLSAPVHLTSDQIQKGRLVGNYVQMATQKLQDAVSDKITALMTVGTYATTAYIAGAGSTMTVAKLSAIYATIKNFPSKLLLLDGGHTAYLIQGNKEQFKFDEGGAYQFDGIAEQNRWTGATANSCGFAFSPSAMGLVSGFPKMDPAVRNVILSSTAQIGIGLSVEVNSWASVAGRQAWTSLDVVFGAGAIDTSVGLRIVTV